MQKLTCSCICITCTHDVCVYIFMLTDPCRGTHSLYCHFITACRQIYCILCVSMHLCVCGCVLGFTIGMWWRCNGPSEWRAGGPMWLRTCYKHTANTKISWASSQSTFLMQALNDRRFKETEYAKALPPARTESWRTSGAVCSVWLCRCPPCSPHWCGSGSAWGDSPNTWHKVCSCERCGFVHTSGVCTYGVCDHSSLLALLLIWPWEQHQYFIWSRRIPWLNTFTTNRSDSTSQEHT